jgi:hypothetical protein
VVEEAAGSDSGHSTITTTMDIYSHVTEEMPGDAAVEIDAA